MDLTSLPTIQDILKRYSFSPSKALGQNFLTDKTALEEIIKTADLKKEGVVLEIGPGLGVLTQELAQKASRVVSVEKDPKMVEILKETLGEFKNIEILKADARYLKPGNLKFRPENYKVVANLPFYLTAPVIREFLETEYPPKEMVFLVQKEMAQRICAKPPKTNLLATSVQFYATPEIMGYVSKECFWPQPKVDSAIIKITPFTGKFTDIVLFFRIIKAGFSQPRKQIANNLSNILHLDKEAVKKWLYESNIKPEQRAQTLSVENWINLASNY